jgi:hypothetical protein
MVHVVGVLTINDTNTEVGTCGHHTVKFSYSNESFISITGCNYECKEEHLIIYILSSPFSKANAFISFFW